MAGLPYGTRPPNYVGPPNIVGPSSSMMSWVHQYSAVAAFQLASTACAEVQPQGIEAGAPKEHLSAMCDERRLLDAGNTIQTATTRGVESGQAVAPMGMYGWPYQQLLHGSDHLGGFPPGWPRSSHAGPSEGVPIADGRFSPRNFFPFPAGSQSTSIPIPPSAFEPVRRTTCNLGLPFGDSTRNRADNPADSHLKENATEAARPISPGVVNYPTPAELFTQKLLATKRTRSPDMSDGPSEKVGNKEQRVSSHVATEKRRRDRINKHFSDLRELVPHIDNKTDKASFLSEVSEYIRMLLRKTAEAEARASEAERQLERQLCTSRAPAERQLEAVRTSTPQVDKTRPQHLNHTHQHHRPEQPHPPPTHSGSLFVAINLPPKCVERPLTPANMQPIPTRLFSHTPTQTPAHPDQTPAHPYQTSRHPRTRT